MELKSENKFGLIPLKKDKRDISFGAFFKFPKLEELPREYLGSEPLEIKNQGSDDSCTGQASAAVSEDQEGVILSPYYTFAKGKMISGDIEGFGLDLRDICKAAVKYGFLEKQDDPGDLPRDGALIDPTLDEKAAIHRKGSYLSVGGNFDLFDAFRTVIWAMRDEKRSIITGCTWKNIWTYSSNGIIPKFDLDKGAFGHAFKIKGWKEINGEPYLIAQLSQGTGVGDEGLFYFPRSVVNKEFTYGAFTFSDMPAEEVKQSWNWRIKLIEFLKNHIIDILK